MADNQFKNVDKAVFEIAGAIDGLIRVLGSSKSFDELELDYLKNWLNKEKDPLLGTIIAQLVGLREVEVPSAPKEDADA
jgi:oligoribonuclease (3'-5' exoribonuclease)